MFMLFISVYSVCRLSYLYNHGYLCVLYKTLQHDLINVLGHIGDQSAAIKPEFYKPSTTGSHKWFSTAGDPAGWDGARIPS